MSRLAPLILAFCFFLAPLPAGASKPLANDGAVHHDLRVTIDPQTSALHGIDTLTVPAEGRPLQLFLSPDADIEEVRVDGLPASRYKFRNGRLTVFLPTLNSRAASVRIAYRAVFDHAVPKNPAHDEDPSYGVTAAITDRGVFLGAGAFWYPLLPGKPALYTIRVEGPPGMEAVTSGRLVKRGQTDGIAFTVWETERPQEALTLAAGPYRIGRREAHGTEIYTFLYPGNAHLSETYLEASAGYIDLYRNLFGPYPFPKFAVAENFFPTGYGFPSWTLLGSTVVRLPFIVDTSLGHEIAHSWWGNGVEVDYDRGNWSEGLTTYVADHLYKERESEEAGREYRLKILRDYTALVSPEEAYPLSEFISRKTAVDQAIGYGKSAMIFHMARQRTGDAHFWEGLRSLVETHFGREASWSNFAAAWKEASGVNLNPFMRQWVERPDAPLLELSEVSVERKDDGWTVRGRLVQQAPFYDLRVPLLLDSPEGAVETILPLHGRSAEFEMKSPAPPVRLVVDPHVDVFRRLHPEEIPPTVNSLRGSEQILAIASDNLPEGTLKAAKGLLQALRHPGARLVREEELEPSDLAGYDLLFLGLPENPSLRPSIPPDLQVTRREFAVEGNRFEEAGSALFAALPHPVDPERSSALFLPFSEEAARQAIRKIPHYGKYSYLAFVSGENRAKGTWPTRSSPLIHNFNPMETRP